jgi:putative ABC transport system permease protein
MLTDLRYTARMLRKSPLFTLAVVLTVALGIGANTAIFSVVNAVMLRPLPYDQPDRLVWIAEKNDKLNLPTFAASVLNYLSWKEQSRTFDRLAAFGFSSFNSPGQDEPERFTGGTITPSLFPLLGIKPVLGRSFRDDEDRPSSPKVVMISEGLWKRRFGGDPSLVGRSLTLNGIDCTVVGIAPAALGLLSNGDLWIPMTIDPGREIRLNHVILAVGRLRPGVTLEQAQAEMNVVAGQVSQQYPEMKDWGIRLVDFYHFFVGPQLRTALVVLLCAVGCVLLIASANVANLLLSRAASRQKEIALRTAIGASRSRLLQQLLVESLVLSVIGGAVGLIAAMWGVDAINTLMPANLLPVPDVRVDRTVLLFALALTIATGLLFGIAPAWHASKTDLNEMLKQTTRSSGGARPRLRNGLAAAELALATILLIGAGLLTQSLMRLQHVSLGFEPERLLPFQLALPLTKYPARRAPCSTTLLLESLRAMPGVRARRLERDPVGAGNYTTTPIARDDGPSPLPPDTAVPTRLGVVSPGSSSAMNIPLLRGRGVPRRRRAIGRAAGRHRQPGDGAALLGRGRSARPHAPSPG